MKLSCIITNHKTLDLLKLCLKSIKETMTDSGIDYEIIVVDNEASDENKWVINDFLPKAIFVNFQNNAGYAKLVNKGIEKSQGDYLLILNADIIVLKGAIKTMLNFLEGHSDVGLIGPQLLNFNHSTQDSCFRFYNIWTIISRRTFLGFLPWGKKIIDNFLMKDYDRQSTKEVDWLMGSAMMVARDALKKVGPMDERFFMYFEDVDWCKRFWQNGFKVIYLPAVKMMHYHHKFSRQKNLFDILFNRYTRIHISSALKYFWKHRHA